MDSSDSDTELDVTQILRVNEMMEANKKKKQKAINEQYIADIFGDLNLNENMSTTSRYIFDSDGNSDTGSTNYNQFNAARRRLFDSCGSRGIISTHKLRLRAVRKRLFDSDSSIEIDDSFDTVRRRLFDSLSSGGSSSQTPQWKKYRLDIREQHRRAKQRSQLRRSRSLDRENISPFRLNEDHIQIYYTPSECSEDEIRGTHFNCLNRCLFSDDENSDDENDEYSDS